MRTTSDALGIVTLERYLFASSASVVCCPNGPVNVTVEPERATVVTRPSRSVIDVT